MNRPLPRMLDLCPCILYATRLPEVVSDFAEASFANTDGRQCPKMPAVRGRDRSAVADLRLVRCPVAARLPATVKLTGAREPVERRSTPGRRPSGYSECSASFDIR